MIRKGHLPAFAAVLAAAFLFGCRYVSPAPTHAPQPALAPPPRVARDASPGIGPPSLAVAGWIEWVSPDGRNAVIELAVAADPPRGRIWWARDVDLKPLAFLAIQPPRRGLRVGAVVTQGVARVGAEVVQSEPGREPGFPPLQGKTSK